MFNLKEVVLSSNTSKCRVKTSLKTINLNQCSMWTNSNRFKGSREKRYRTQLVCLASVCDSTHGRNKQKGTTKWSFSMTRHCHMLHNQKRCNGKSYLTRCILPPSDYISKSTSNGFYDYWWLLCPWVRKTPSQHKHKSYLIVYTNFTVLIQN